VIVDVPYQVTQDGNGGQFVLTGDAERTLRGLTPSKGGCPRKPGGGQKVLTHSNDP
jgi:hypothetical protein